MVSFLKSTFRIGSEAFTKENSGFREQAIMPVSYFVSFVKYFYLTDSLTSFWSLLLIAFVRLSIIWFGFLGQWTFQGG